MRTFMVKLLLLALVTPRVASYTLQEVLAAREQTLNIISEAYLNEYTSRGCEVNQGCMEVENRQTLACGTVPYIDGENGAVCTMQLGRGESCTQGQDGRCDGMMLNVERGVIRMPHDYENDNTELSRFICTAKAVDTTFASEWNKGALNAWAYVSSTSGGFKTFPGKHVSREEGFCSPYDPRIRPWYVAAASGPKDLLLILDTSGSMNDALGTKSRRELMVGAVNKLIDTLTGTDYVSIVTFADEAKVVCPIEGTCGMMKASGDVVSGLKEQVSGLVAKGRTFMSKGFEKGFDVLLKARSVNYPEGSMLGTSGCNTVVLFLTDGFSSDDGCRGSQDNSPGCGLSASTEVIDRGQEALVRAGGQRAAIFTLSMGSESDRIVPQTIACQNSGVWKRIPEGADPLSQMKEYYQYNAMALGDETTQIRWTSPYVDASGLGKMVTAAKPMFTIVGGKSRLIGVAGTDLLWGELLDAEGSTEDKIFDLLYSKNTGAKCFDARPSPCDLQMLREEEDACDAGMQFKGVSNDSTAVVMPSYAACAARPGYQKECNFGFQVSETVDEKIILQPAQWDVEKDGDPPSMFVGGINPHMPFECLLCCSGCGCSLSNGLSMATVIGIVVGCLLGVAVVAYGVYQSRRDGSPEPRLEEGRGSVPSGRGSVAKSSLGSEGGGKLSRRPVQPSERSKRSSLDPPRAPSGDQDQDREKGKQREEGGGIGSRGSSSVNEPDFSNLTVPGAGDPSPPPPPRVPARLREVGRAGADPSPCGAARRDAVRAA